MNYDYYYWLQYKEKKFEILRNKFINNLFRRIYYLYSSSKTLVKHTYLGNLTIKFDINLLYLSKKNGRHR